MKENYFFDLLTPQGTLVARLDCVQSCELNANVNRQIRWEGKLTLPPSRLSSREVLGRVFTKHEISQQLIWAGLRLKVSYQKNDDPPFPLGVFLLEPDTIEVFESQYEQDLLGLNLFERTKIPASDVVENPHTERKGQKISDRVKFLLESVGESNVSVTDQPMLLRTDMVWDAGTSKLRIINDLLEAGGFFSLHTSSAGQYQIAPYQPPSKRPIAAKYLPDTKDLYAPNVVTDYPQIGVNKVVLIAKGDGETPDLKATATNDADYQITGVWRTLFDGQVEAASQEVLNDMARRRLLQANRATWTRARNTEIIPLSLNDVIYGSDGLETVEEISLSCKPGQLYQLKTRQVKDT